MYIPSAFREDDPAVLREIIAANSFATLVTVREGVPFATHLPLLLDGERGALGTLRGHVARANPQWQDLEQQQALVLFQGPHGYVSPSWYETDPAVPTWNYEAVHAYGRARLLEGERPLLALLHELATHFEQGRAQPWKPHEREEFSRRLLPGIVGFEIEIERLEGKRKLSQNRPEADRRGVIQALRSAGDAELQRLAERMTTQTRKIDA